MHKRGIRRVIEGERAEEWQTCNENRKKKAKKTEKQLVPLLNHTVKKVEGSVLCVWALNKFREGDP